MFTGVESVEIIKQTDIKKFNELCPDGFVYDLEVEDNHNYFANRILVHNCAAYPKPSLRTKAIKDLVGHNPLILLSGTPTPESHSQIYHQLWISKNSPFNNYTNFYKWAKDFVKVKQKLRNGFFINDYSNADKEKIEGLIGYLYVKYTQQEAGFTQVVNDVVVYVQMKPTTKKLIEVMLKDKYYKGKDGSDIVADTAAKLQNKVHQICSGTVIDEQKNRHIFDRSKAEYIKENYKDKKIAIFYKYIAELEVIKDMFPDAFTTSEEFNNSLSGVYISQIRSGAMGVNLSTADYIIMYNIDFPAVLYWQARQRMQSMQRAKPCEVHWIFSVGGIEDKIYKTVLKKRDYTTYYFKKDFLKEI